MQFEPGSLWKTQLNVILQVAYQEGDLVYVFYAVNKNEVNPIVTSYMLNGSFVQSWVPYIEGQPAYKTRFQMILDKHG